MQSEETVRWKQRFQNFTRAYLLLSQAINDNEIDELSDLECEGIIQRFEFTFELAWKTLKDFLENEGIVLNPVTPRNVIKTAFEASVISDGQTWLNMMLHRNLLSHTYDYEKFQEVLMQIKEKYIFILENFHNYLMERYI